MKYIFLLVSILTAGAIQSDAQTFRMSAKAGGLPNSSIITAMPNFNYSAKLGEFGFVIMVPKENPPGTPIPAPTIVVKTTCATCLNVTFPPANWQQTTDFVSDPNFYLYKFGCVNPNIATSPLLTINNGVEQDVVALQFTGSTASATQIRLAHLPDGGPGTQYGAAIIDDTPPVDKTNYVQMFYGPGVIPAAPHPDEGTGYSNLQFVPLANISLPNTDLFFTAYKQDNNAVLNWVAENINGAISHFEIERSLDGQTFTRISRAEVNASGQNNYGSVDAGVFNSNPAKVYYRVKLVERSGSSRYSAIRTLKAGSKGFALNVYPNPAVKEANITFTLAEARQVSLLVTDATGKRYTEMNMQAQKGINQKSIDVSSLAAGTYMIRIVANDETQTLSFVKSN